MANVAARSESYIFDGAGGMRDQLEQAILTELQKQAVSTEGRNQDC